MTDLTIVVPVKGRPRHTQRFLRHAARQRLKWPIIVVGPDDPGYYSGINLRYVAVPDLGRGRMREVNAAMAAGAEAVETPYAMMAHDDDFILPTGVQRALDCLGIYSRYVCCWGGLCAGFDIQATQYPAVSGPINRLRVPFNHDCRATIFGENDAEERILAGVGHQAIPFGVYRTDAFRTLWRESMDHGFLDGGVHEYFSRARTLSLGKVVCDSRFASYLKQYEPPKQPTAVDWVDGVVWGDFAADFAHLLDLLPTPRGSERMRKNFASRMREALRYDLGAHPVDVQLKLWLIHRHPRVAGWLRRSAYVAQRQRGRFLTTFAEPYRTHLASELAAIEGTLRS